MGLEQDITPLSVCPLDKPWGSFWKQEQIQPASLLTQSCLAVGICSANTLYLGCTDAGAAMEMQLEEYQMSPGPWTAWWVDRTCLPRQAVQAL